MTAYQLHIYEQQEEREALEQKICEQVDTCLLYTSPSPRDA